MTAKLTFWSFATAFVSQDQNFWNSKANKIPLKNFEFVLTRAKVGELSSKSMKF